MGFTLIELLIVIAIILILIAIALPNFLEAQIRSRVVRAKGDIRHIGIAMEAYFLDWKMYPSFSFPNYHFHRDRRRRGFSWLTSPVKYMTGIPEDPFPGMQSAGGHNISGPPPYSYTLDGVRSPLEETFVLHPDAPGISNLKAWCIYSLGPDRPGAETLAHHNDSPIYNSGNPISTYAPTNGTKSKGDIMMWGGDQRWMGVHTDANIYAHDRKFKVYPKPGQFVNDIFYLHRFPPGP